MFSKATISPTKIQMESHRRSTTRTGALAIPALYGVIAILAIIAAGAGLFYSTDGGPYEITTPRGETVELHGHGLYHYDSVMRAAANRGSDVLTLAVGLPLMIAAAILHQRGSLRGTLLLIGALVYILYVYASLSLGTAYNHLFLVYVGLFGACVIALSLAIRAASTRCLEQRIAATMPRKGPAAFMIFSGVVTLGIWLVDPLAALIANEAPGLLESSTTLITHALDLAIIVPAAFAAGVLILRGEATGYILAIALLVLEAMLAPMIALQTVFQLSAGVTYTTAEVLGPIGGFVALSLVSIWVLVVILKNIDDADQYSGTKLLQGTAS
jgi:hypothetical protein